jgi:hypothetical protein
MLVEQASEQNGDVVGGFPAAHPIGLQEPKHRSAGLTFGQRWIVAPIDCTDRWSPDWPMSAPVENRSLPARRDDDIRPGA